MVDCANVTVHESVYPDRLQLQLAESLGLGELDHKFLYLGLKQSLRWLALHETYSPARQDPGCLAIYDTAFSAASKRTGANVLHLVGLGSGGGQKETRCLELLRNEGKTAFFTPCDVSVELALTAHLFAVEQIKGLQSSPIVCDLPLCTTLPGLLKNIDPAGTTRLITFFGMIHNFGPGQILPRIINSVRSQDLLLLSANLSPGEDYEAGLQAILPQYENELTRDWIMGFSEEIGISKDAGTLRFTIESTAEDSALKRIEANFHFERNCEVQVQKGRYQFKPGDSLRLFYSYRYADRQIPHILKSFGLRVVEQWTAPSGEEAVYMCQRLSQA